MPPDAQRISVCFASAMNSGKVLAGRSLRTAMISGMRTSRVMWAKLFGSNGSLSPRIGGPALIDDTPVTAKV